jgi:hypothetical protein
MEIRTAPRDKAQEAKRVLVTRMRYFVVFALAAVAVCALGAGAAVASSDSASSPSGTFTVSVWYPDVVAAGTTATASETVANTSSAIETLTLTNTLTGSNGAAYTQTQLVTLAPAETFTQYSIKVKRSDVGSYTLTFTASDGSESATVAATFTVVRKYAPVTAGRTRRSRLRVRFVAHSAGDDSMEPLRQGWPGGMKCRPTRSPAQSAVAAQASSGPCGRRREGWN